MFVWRVVLPNIQLSNMILVITLIYLTGYSASNEVSTDSGVNHRFRRAVNETDPYSSDLESLGAWTASSDISIGDKVPFNYTLVVPQNGCQQLSVSINTSLVTGENVFSLCNVHVAYIGPNIIGVVPTDFVPVRFKSSVPVGSLESYKFDSAFIDFGDITTNAGFNETIFISFDVIVVNSSIFTASDVYDIIVTADFTYNAAPELTKANVSLTAVNRNPLSSTASTFSLTGQDSLWVGGTTNWTLSLVLLDAYTSLSVRASLNGSVAMAMPTCGINFISSGLHFSCLEETSFSSSLTSNWAEFNIPTLLNTGFSLGNTNAPENEVLLSVCVDIPQNLTSADDVYLNVAVYLNGALTWTSANLINVTANETLDSAPSKNTILLPHGAWNESTTDISIGDKIPFSYTVAVPQNGCQQLTISINTSLVAGENVFSLCNVHVASIGPNILGVVPTDFIPVIVKSTVAASSIISYKDDSAYIVFGDLTTDNTGNGTAYHIVVSFDVIVANSSVWTVNDVYNVMTKAQLTVAGTPQVWDNVFNLTAIGRDPYSVVPPTFNLTGPASMGIGDVGNWTVHMNLRDAYSQIKIRAWVNGTYTYPACSIYFVDKGEHYTCLNEASGYVTRTQDAVEFNVPTVINTGFGTANINNDANNVVVNVFTLVPPYVTVSDEMYMNVDVFLDDKLSWNINELMTLTAGTPPTTTSVPTLQLGAQGGILEATKGAGTIFTIDVGTPPGAITSYDVSVTTDTGKTRICDVKVMKVGNNVCMDDNVGLTYTTPSQVDVAIGSVPNLFPGADPSDPNNQFRLEVLVCIEDTVNVNVADVLTLSVVLDYNDGAASIPASLTYTVVATPDPSKANGSLTFSAPSTKPANIAEVVQINVTVIFPPSDDFFDVMVDVPVSGDNAQALVEDVTLLSVADTLPCMVNRSLVLINSLLTSHTQVYRQTYSLGAVTYPGFVERSPFDLPNVTSPAITVQITLMLGDHVLNTQGALVPITTTLTGTSGVTIATTDYISVQITGSETPMLVMFLTMDPFHYTQKIAGDNITFHVGMYLNETSTAHAQNVVVHVMSPLYISFADIYDIQDVNVTQTTFLPEPGMAITVGEIDFKDNVSFSFNLTLDPGRTMPAGTQNVWTVLPADITYGNQLRADRADTGVHYSGLSVFEFGFGTDNATGLGMEDGTILDCQLTASSSRDGYPASDARLIAGQGWQPAIRGSPFCGNDYLQIDVGYPAFITGLKIQSSTESANDIVTSFQLLYSDNSFGGWTHVTYDNGNPAIFTIDTSGGSSTADIYEVTINETSRFTARYLRILPTVTSCTFGLRFELYGIRQTAPLSPCSADPGANYTAPLMSYIVNSETGTIFVCGITEIGGQVGCSKSDEAGDSWQALDESISMVTATVYNTSTVVGRSHDGQFMVSLDDGNTWEAVSDAELAEITGAPGYVSNAVDFPLADHSSTTTNNMYAAYGAVGDTFEMTGVMEGLAINTGGPWNVMAWWGSDDWSAL